MNCRRIEELIPLYVESDLDAVTTEMMTSHLGICPSCRGTVTQYEESQRWLRSCAAPELDEITLAHFRRDVMAEINATRRPWFLFNNFNAIQIALASALILLALIAAAIYITRPASQSSLSTSSEVAGDKAVSTPSGQDGSEPDRANQGGGERRGPSRQHRNAGIRMRKRSAEINTAQLVSRAGPRYSIDYSAGAQASSSSTGSPLRIELQTADPTIRIIWFTARENDSSKPVSEE